MKNQLTEREVATRVGANILNFQAYQVISFPYMILNHIYPIKY